MALLDALQAIERDMGRRKVIDKGPRNIDLDILLYGDETLAHQRLTIPHAGIKEREFVLRPLAEFVAPLNPAHFLHSNAQLTLPQADSFPITRLVQAMEACSGLSE